MAIASRRVFRVARPFSRATTQHVGYTTDLLTRYTLQWLKTGRDAKRPFMLMMQHKAPHRPWDPAPDRLDDYAEVTFSEPPNLFDDYANRSSAAKRAEMRIADETDMRTRGPDLKAGVPLATGHIPGVHWTKITSSFTYTGGPGLLTLTFVNGEDSFFNSQSAFVDNVSIITVPEPTTALLLGLGSLGMLFRRRR